MGEKVSQDQVRLLTDARLTVLCRFYGVRYARTSVTTKADRVWSELVRREGGTVGSTVRATVPRSVWTTVVESSGEKAEALFARQRELARRFGEPPFPIPEKRGTVSKAVSIFESMSPQKPSSGAGQSSKREGEDEDEVGSALGWPARGDGATSDAAMSDARSIDDSDGDWERPKTKKSNKKGSKHKAKGKDAAGGSSAERPPKRIEDMPKATSGHGPNKSADQARLVEQVVQAVPATFEPVCATLRAVRKELQKPEAARDGRRDLDLADRAGHALQLIEAFLAGITTERLNSAVRNKETKTAPGKAVQGPARRGAAGRSWRDVAAGAPAAMAPAPPRFEWDPRRTLFLRPDDPAAAKRSIEAVEFGRRFASLFSGIPEFSGWSPQDLIKRLVRLPTNGWKVLLHEAAVKYVPRRTFVVPGAGAWTPEAMRAPTSASVVVYGVPRSMPEDEVAASLARGSQVLLEDKDRSKLAGLCVRRLFARGQARTLAATGERAPDTADPQPTRACRVFLPSDLAQSFANRGEMMLDYVGLRCKEYVPRRYYCKVCGGFGSHSTQFHRSQGDPDRGEAPPPGGHVAR